ncbi:hypothetical protein C8Q74DRAFT_301942 [Fomes fomentarius]|nr:hypothetical protein C8Q74DRAFT_301942 [Fomes fomentarius]
MRSCLVWSYLPVSLQYVQYLLWAVFSTLRAYALGSKSWPLALLVFLPSIAPMIVNYVWLGYMTVEYSNPDGCNVAYRISDLNTKHRTSLIIVSRTCLIISDILVMIITWTATYRNSKDMAALHQGTSVSKILLRDGAIYVIVLVIMNALHLGFSLFSILKNADANGISSDISIFTEALTAVLISRFLIDLQEAHRKMSHRHSHLSAVSSISLSRVIGAFGTSLPAAGDSYQPDV